MLQDVQDKYCTPFHGINLKVSYLPIMTFMTGQTGRRYPCSLRWLGHTKTVVTSLSIRVQPRHESILVCLERLTSHSDPS